VGDGSNPNKKKRERKKVLESRGWILIEADRNQIGIEKTRKKDGIKEASESSSLEILESWMVNQPTTLITKTNQSSL
jgi:hypothetical protein